MMSTSCRTSAGGSRAAETRETRRSMFITVPGLAPRRRRQHHVRQLDGVGAERVLDDQERVFEGALDVVRVGHPRDRFVATVQQTSTTLSRASSSMIRTNPGPDESGSRLSGTPHALAIALR